jgi:hypothetical protein
MEPTFTTTTSSTTTTTPATTGRAVLLDATMSFSDPLLDGGLGGWSQLRQRVPGCCPG